MTRFNWVIAVTAMSLIIVALCVPGEPLEADASGDGYSPGPVAGISAAGGADALSNGTTNRPEAVSLPVPDPSSRRWLAHSLTLVSPLTGAGSPARTDERWNIAGTDLGFSFDHGGTLYLVFGDTWGRNGIEGSDWRSNVMAIAEPDPEHGYILTDAITDHNGEAKELLPSLKEPRTEYTVIPTAAIAIGDRMFLHYMSIRDWIPTSTGYKHPDVNGAGFAYSDDLGQTWVKDGTAAWDGDTAFTQAAMVADEEYVYVFGTPAGRFGALKLLRARRDSLLQPDQYQYWSGSDWQANADDAAEVVPAPVGEISVRWSAYHERWLMMYRNEVDKAIVLRTAAHLTGPWDREQVVLTSAEYPTNYAPFMFPVEGPDVYFAMSIFSPDYQVYVMRLTLSP